MPEGGAPAPAPAPAAAAGAPKPAPKLKIRAPTPSVSTANAAPSDAAADAQGPSPRQGIPSLSPRPPRSSGPRPERYSEKESEADIDNTNEPPLLGPGKGATPYLRLLHQRTELSLAYQDGRWAYGGETTLWLVDEGTYGSNATGGDGVAGSPAAGGDAVPPAAAAIGTPGGAATPAKSPGPVAVIPPPPPQRRRELALHLRGGCRVESVNVESCIVTATAMTTSDATAEGDTAMKEATDTTAAATNTNTSVTTSASMQPIPSEFVHLDPLQTVLRKPAASYTADEFEAEMMEAALHDNDGNHADGNVDDIGDGPGISKGRCHADTQCARGGAGMMDAIRLASAASRNGELRISVGDVSAANEEEQAQTETKPPRARRPATCGRPRSIASPSSDPAAVDAGTGRPAPPHPPGRSVREATRRSDQAKRCRPRGERSAKGGECARKLRRGPSWPS